MGVQGAADSAGPVLCVSERRLEFSPGVHAGECAGAGVVGGAVLGREGRVQWRGRELQLGEVGGLGMAICGVWFEEDGMANSEGRKKAQTPIGSS